MLNVDHQEKEGTQTRAYYCKEKEHGKCLKPAIFLMAKMQNSRLQNGSPRINGRHHGGYVHFPYIVQCQRRKCAVLSILFYCHATGQQWSLRALAAEKTTTLHTICPPDKVSKQLLNISSI